MSVFICKGCGYVSFGEAPEKCPVCGAPREMFTQNDAVFEESARNSPEGAGKHTPVVTVNTDCGLIPEKSCTDVLVRVGETLHPMEEKHYISFIDCYVDSDWVSRIQLSPAMYPGVVFHLQQTGKTVTVVEHCSLHGYWKAEASL